MQTKCRLLSPLLASQLDCLVLCTKDEIYVSNVYDIKFHSTLRYLATPQFILSCFLLVFLWMYREWINQTVFIHRPPLLSNLTKERNNKWIWKGMLTLDHPLTCIWSSRMEPALLQLAKLASDLARNTCRNIIISCHNIEGSLPAISPTCTAFAWETGNEQCSNLQCNRTGRIWGCGRTPRA